MAMVSQLTSASNALELDYQHLLAEAILTMVSKDPNYNKNSFDEMIALIQKRVVLDDAPIK